MSGRRPSFRWRLALLSAGVSGIILGGFALAAWVLMHRQLERALDARMAVPLSRLVGQIDRERDWATEVERHLSRFGSAVDTDQMEVAVYDNRPDGYAYYTDNARWMKDAFDMESRVPSKEALDAFLDNEENDVRPRRPPGPNSERPRRPLPPIGDADFFRADDTDGTMWRVGVQSNPEVTVFLAMNPVDFGREENRLRRLFLAALPFGLFAIGFGGWLMSGRAIRPVKRVTEAAKEMNALGLDQRIPRTGRESAEFSQLIDVLNDMMARLETSFHQATRFTADASHELKTPIAVMQAELASALKRCGPDSPEAETYQSLSEETHRLKQIVQSLLLLSQVDSGGLKIRKVPMDLSLEMHALCEDAEVLCEGAELDFSGKIQDGVGIEADPVLFVQAVQNLLSNAVKYNRKGGCVQCELTQSNGTTRILFTNTGEAIPEEKKAHIFERFYRVDSARNRGVDGFGLGLDLSREIIRSHGGDLRLVRSDKDQTVFEIVLETVGDH